MAASDRLLMHVTVHPQPGHSHSTGGGRVTQGMASSTCLLPTPCASPWTPNKNRLCLEHLLPTASSWTDMQEKTQVAHRHQRLRATIEPFEIIVPAAPLCKQHDCHRARHMKKDRARRYHIKPLSIISQYRAKHLHTLAYWQQLPPTYCI